MDPGDAIFPIFTIAPGRTLPIDGFCGTGFFIAPSGLLVTAAHVAPTIPGCTYGIGDSKNAGPVYPIECLARDEKVDLAVFRSVMFAPRHLLQVGSGPGAHNQLVVTFEYGTTRTGGNMITISPATRVGNITRVFNLTAVLGKAGEEVLELSFPALRGASGAPVLGNQGTGAVEGIIVANTSYHLLPAQIETVLDEENSILEETKYMLPQAVAVNVRHLRELLQRHSL